MTLQLRHARPFLFLTMRFLTLTGDLGLSGRAGWMGFQAAAGGYDVIVGVTWMYDLVNGRMEEWSQPLTALRGRLG
jgi:hypothetical protein